MKRKNIPAKRDPNPNLAFPLFPSPSPRHRANPEAWEGVSVRRYSRVTSCAFSSPPYSVGSLELGRGRARPPCAVRLDVSHAELRNGEG